MAIQWGSFTLTLNKTNTEKYEIIEAFKDGLKQGYFYKAWTIVLSNSKIYAHYFKDYYSIKANDSEALQVEVNKQDAEIEYVSQKIEKINDLKYKNQIWFKVGVLFAKGEMNKYFNKGRTGFDDNYSAPKVAKEIGNTSYDKFILATINNYDSNNPNGSKNIFNSKDKMVKIIAHCKELSLPIDEYFLLRLPKE